MCFPLQLTRNNKIPIRNTKYPQAVTIISQYYAYIDILIVESPNSLTLIQKKLAGDDNKYYNTPYYNFIAKSHILCMNNKYQFEWILVSLRWYRFIRYGCAPRVYIYIGVGISCSVLWRIFFHLQIGSHTSLYIVLL